MKRPRVIFLKTPPSEPKLSARTSASLSATPRNEASPPTKRRTNATSTRSSMKGTGINGVRPTSTAYVAIVRRCGPSAGEGDDAFVGEEELVACVEPLASGVMFAMTHEINGP
jgi:hypothetical protein